ncbi:MAG: NAD(P)H-hydrate dehydratase [Paracoccaceae bacterium]
MSAEILTSAQMRAIEAAAIESGAVTGLELMERAGQAVVEAILAEWPELAGGGRAVVLCGPGNNGGDGFVVARLLVGLGWSVRVLGACEIHKMPADAAQNARLWQEIGAIEALTEDTLRAGPESDLYIDAIFGTGLRRPPSGEIAAVLTHISGRNGDTGSFPDRLVAVDAPSGMCMDSGRTLIEGVARARLTVCFDSLKPGHVLAQGPNLCGKVVVADIGLAPWRTMVDPVQTQQGIWSGGAVRVPSLGLVGPSDDSLLVPGAFRPATLDKGGIDPAQQHKFAHGHALILGGPTGQGGAARLAARSALRVGAGLVTLGCPPDTLLENAARLDAVMLRPVADAKALDDALTDGRINALCLGPGMGVGPRERALVGRALASGRPMVLDADALTLIAHAPDLFGTLHSGCVLTPHGGEFARLFPDIAARLKEPATRGPAFSKLDATREAAARAGCVVLFKGPDTVVAHADGRAAIHPAAYGRAAPWLATAGAGDVLAGIIAGLLARGFKPFDAACTGAWLHVEAARSFGPGLIAEDLPDRLPAVLRALSAG